MPAFAPRSAHASPAACCHLCTQSASSPRCLCPVLSPPPPLPLTLFAAPALGDVAQGTQGGSPSRWSQDRWPSPRPDRPGVSLVGSSAAWPPCTAGLTPCTCGRRGPTGVGSAGPASVLPPARPAGLRGLGAPLCRARGAPQGTQPCHADPLSRCPSRASSASNESTSPGSAGAAGRW